MKNPKWKSFTIRKWKKINKGKSIWAKKNRKVFLYLRINITINLDNFVDSMVSDNSNISIGDNNDKDEFKK